LSVVILLKGLRNLIGKPHCPTGRVNSPLELEIAGIKSFLVRKKYFEKNSKITHRKTKKNGAKSFCLLAISSTT
jgi:hypothetical protein